MIYFLCPSPLEDGAPGGVRKIYDWAKILHDAGHSVEIVPTYRPKPIVEPSATDLVVVPEVYGDELARVWPHAARVSLNQNPYYSWSNVEAEHPYHTAPRFLGVVTVSAFARGFLEDTFFTEAEREVLIIPPAIDPSLFYFDPAEKDPNVLAYMPRKDAAATAPIVLGMARERGILEGLELIPITGMSREDTAALLRRAGVFLSLARHEGLGLPGLEALACGCSLVGWSGGGGADYWDHWMDQDDIEMVLRHLAMTVAIGAPPDDYRRDWELRVHNGYKLEAERRAVLEIFGSLARKAERGLEARV